MNEKIVRKIAEVLNQYHLDCLDKVPTALDPYVDPILDLIAEEVEKRIKVMARRTGKTMSTLELMTDTPIREIDEAIAQERAEILEEIKDICGFYDYTDEYNTASDIEEKIETYLNHKDSISEDGENILNPDLVNHKGDPDDISLCKDGCFCMTKTIDGKCGKCGAIKESEIE